LTHSTLSESASLVLRAAAVTPLGFSLGTSSHRSKPVSFCLAKPL